MEIGLEVLGGGCVEMKFDADTAVQADAAILHTVLDVEKETDPGVAQRHVAGSAEFETILVVVVLHTDAAIAASHRDCPATGEIDERQLPQELRRIERLQRNRQRLDSAYSGRSRHLKRLPACAHHPGPAKSDAGAISDPLRMRPARRPAAARL